MLRIKALASAIALSISASAVAAQTELDVIWMGSGPESEIFDTFVERFEKEHSDIKINIQYYPNESYKTAFKIRTTSNNPPDVFFNWAGSRTNTLVDDGLIYDLNKLNLKNLERVTPALTTQFSYKGIQAGAPYKVYSKYMFQNNEVFEELNLSTPETMNDLLAICSAVQEQAPYLSPVIFGASEPWTINHYLSQLIGQTVPVDVLMNDLRMETAADTLFTHPGYVQALAELDSMNKAGCFNDGVNSVTPEAARSIFGAEMAAMTFEGEWGINPLIEDGLTDFTPFPMPTLNNGEAGVPGSIMAGTEGFVVHSQTKRPETAATFIDFFLSDEIQADLSYAYGLVPANANGVDLSRHPEQMASVFKDIQNAPGLTPALDTLMHPRLDRLFLNLGQELINQSITPEEIMEQVRKEAVSLQQS